MGNALDQAGQLYVWKMSEEALSQIETPFTGEEVARRISEQPAVPSGKGRRGIFGRITEVFQ